MKNNFHYLHGCNYCKHCIRRINYDNDSGFDYYCGLDGELTNDILNSQDDPDISLEQWRYIIHLVFGHQVYRHSICDDFVNK